MFPVPLAHAAGWSYSSCFFFCPGAPVLPCARVPVPALSRAYPDAPGAGSAALPDGPDALLPLGPLALALLPGPLALEAVPPLLFFVPAEEPPVPSVDALTPLPAVALPPLPAVLALLALLFFLPDVPEVVAPLVLVVVLLSALRTPVPPSA